MMSTLYIIGSLLCITQLTCANSKTTEHKDEVSDNSAIKPSDVEMVSQFIKEFHRQIGDVVLWVPENPASTPMKTATSSHNQTIPQDEANSTYVVSCNKKRLAGSHTVELVNSTRLVNLLVTDSNITSRNQKAECVVLLFYARTCPFSCMTAPHFNALPRAFPTIKVAAVNALQYKNFNTQYGIVGVPTVILFHNGRPAAKFNDSEYTLDMFTRFITRHTGILPEEKMFVTSADFGGPVASVLAKETDYWLGLSWVVITVVLGIGVAKSRMWSSLVEAVQNSWREAEAQHFHAD